MVPAADGTYVCMSTAGSYGWVDNVGFVPALASQPSPCRVRSAVADEMERVSASRRVSLRVCDAARMRRRQLCRYSHDPAVWRNVGTPEHSTSIVHSVDRADR